MPLEAGVHTQFQEQVWKSGLRRADVRRKEERVGDMMPPKRKKP
jgi:hypothetical protein